MLGYLEQPAQTRHRARGYHVELPASAFDLVTHDSRVEAERIGSPVEKVCAELARFDQSDRPLNKAGEDDSGEPGPGPDIQPGSP
jgi:hypothetical protein